MDPASFDQRAPACWPRASTAFSWGAELDDAVLETLAAATARRLLKPRLSWPGAAAGVAGQLEPRPVQACQQDLKPTGTTSCARAWPLTPPHLSIYRPDVDGTVVRLAPKRGALPLPIPDLA